VLGLGVEFAPLSYLLARNGKPQDLALDKLSIMC